MNAMSTDERLVYMANQIARNLGCGSIEKAALATADHIATFWDPRMREQILAFRASGRPDFDEAAAQAIDRLRDKGAIKSQTAATSFNAVNESGHSDAG